MSSTKTTETARQLRAAQLVECFNHDYPAYQYALVEFFVEHLTDVSRSLGGDLEQVMVLAILGQRRLNVFRNAEQRDTSATEGMSISASRLADATGIPRETVRRKLALLKDRGWVVQVADGSWALAPEGDADKTPARRDLSALDLRGRQRVARLVAALESMGPRPRKR